MSFLYQLSEYIYTPMFGASYLFDRITNHFQPRYKKGVPILLLHGKSGNRAQWAFVKYLLDRDERLGPVFACNYVTDEQGNAYHFSSPLDTPIELFAKNVAEEVERILELTGAEQIDLIGHSMGGVTAALVAEELLVGKVRVVVTLGSPFRGSPLIDDLDKVSCNLFSTRINSSKALQQLKCNSKMLERIVKKIEETSDVKYVHIAGTMDLLVPPSHAGVKGVIKMRSGHFGFVAPRSKQFWKRVIIPAMLDDPVCEETIEQYNHDPMEPFYSLFW